MPKTKAVERERSDSGTQGEDPAPTISLSDLPTLTPEELRGLGFPYDVPIELTADQGREVERILARGAPEWVRKLRQRSGR
jgi:hypothetical protein